jgi:hypothetical protein
MNIRGVLARQINGQLRKKMNIRKSAMKKHIILIGLFLSYSITLFAQGDNKNYILALSVDLYMNTSSRVACDNFAVVFEKVLTINTVSQSDSIALFSSFVRNVKYSKRKRDIDVRCKFVYAMDDIHTIIVCTDGRSILVNGKLIKKNKKFINFLNSIVHRYP